MLIMKYILGSLMVAILSVAYNYFAFSFLDIYPDLSIDVQFFRDFGLNFYFVIFLKNFLVALVLMYLFAQAYKNLDQEKSGDKYLLKAVAYFSLYAIFAFVSFALVDLALIRSEGGILLIITVNAFVESFIATVPIKFFYASSDAN